MELREQAYVTTIARHGSLKQAAAELHISPPTLSIFLSNLEKELGLQLFDRLGKRFVPTEAGRIYLENAREMLRFQERCRAQLGDLRQGSTGSVRFGIHPRRTLYLLAQTLKNYEPFHPGIQVTACEQSSDEMFRLLAMGELDFIVNNQYDPDPALIYEPFYSDRLVMVVRADHPLAADIPAPEDGGTAWVDLKRFEREPFILQKSHQSSRIYTDRAMDYAGISPQSRYVLENLESAAQLAAEGLGIAFNFESYIRHFHYHKPVRWFYVGDRETVINYSIIYRRDKYMPTYVKDLIAALQEALELDTGR